MVAHANPEPGGESVAFVVRRAPRLANDPHKYVRRVKGGKWEARPYCPIEGERYALGELFPTRELACRAVLDFWAGRRKECPRFTKRINQGGEVRYLALVPWGNGQARIGIYPTREEAAAAVWGFLLGACGPLFALALLRRH